MTSLQVEGRGAGPGTLDVVVNGGRVTSHVHTAKKERFVASFIPHEVGKHRLDVKFNGEKVHGSPCFVDVSCACLLGIL
jgi:hypothetical protein